MKRNLIVGSNWNSGSDETTFDNLHVKKDNIGIDVNYKFRFDEGGLLSKQGKESPIDVISGKSSLVVDHGYYYIASKEIFIYANKYVDITKANHISNVPNYIKVALGSYENNMISSGMPSGIVSGISSGLFTRYDLTSVPSYMTPMVITEIGEEPYKVPSYINTETSFNESRLLDLTIPEGKFTGLEEPISEIYEVETIKNIHETVNNIINPSEYVYDYFSNSVYMKGDKNDAIIEYEISNNKGTVLDSNFRISKIGKQSGLLSLVDETDKRTTGSTINTQKRNIDIRGTQIFITQDEIEESIITISTIYTDEVGINIDYTTIDNNFQYAKIISDRVNTDLYLDGIKLGRLDSEGKAIIPIASYANNGLHSSFLVTGSKRIDLFPSPKLPLSGKVKISVSDINGLNIFEEDILSIYRNDITVSIGKPIDSIIYIEEMKSNIELEEAVLLHQVYIETLKDSYRQDVLPILVDDIIIDHTNITKVMLAFEQATMASYIKFSKLPYHIIPPYGGPNYGKN